MGVTLSEEQLDQFEIYFHELADWNQRANLTAITGYEDVQVKHFLDSLTICLTAREYLAGPVRVMDVGAGAGLPGLALKLAFPEIKLALLESVKKKSAFLHHIVDELGLEDVSVYTGRAEDLAREKDLPDGGSFFVSKIPFRAAACPESQPPGDNAWASAPFFPPRLLSGRRSAPRSAPWTLVLSARPVP